MTYNQNPAQPQDHSMNDEDYDQRLEAAKLYVKQLQAFYVHAGFFVIGMIAIIGVNLATNLAAGIAGEWGAWWSVWAFLGWGLGIAVHGLVVRLNRPSSASSDWEQRMVDKVLSSGA
jgi:hypothetical protein